MTMYEKVEMLAGRKGITVAQVEKDIGAPPASLRKLKTHQPSADRILSLARYFGVTTDYLYGETDIERPVDAEMDPDLISLERARQNMSDSEWQKAMDILRAGFAAAFDD